MADRSELALQLTDAVAAAYQAVERAGNRAYKSFGLSQRAHAAMAAVDLGGPDGARPSDVARELGVSRAAATTFTQRLEAKGLVETTTDPDDDRGVRVTLTRHGLEVLLRVGQLERRLAARTIEGLPASAMARTIHVLQELRQRLEQKVLEVVRRAPIPMCESLCSRPQCGSLLVSLHVVLQRLFLGVVASTHSP